MGPAVDRLLDLMLAARLAEELSKPEHERGSEHDPSRMFSWGWGVRSGHAAGVPRKRYWVRVVWHGAEHEEEAHSRNEAARRLLYLVMDPEGDAGEGLAA